jgi:hypothetical protein
VRTGGGDGDVDHVADPRSNTHLSALLYYVTPDEFIYQQQPLAPVFLHQRFFLPRKKSRKRGYVLE